MNNFETTYKKESQEGGFESTPSIAEERIKELAKESNHFAPEDKEEKAREIELLRAEIMAGVKTERNSAQGVSVGEVQKIGFDHEDIEQIATPGEKAFQKYNEAISSAEKIIASAEQDSNGVKQVMGTNPANAQHLLDTMSWDRSFISQSTQETPLVQVPDSVIEAQRLLFNAYNPSDKIQQFQKQGYQNTCEKVSEQELITVIDTWSTMDFEKKKGFFKSFGTKLSSSFGFKQEVPIIFMTEEMAGVEATYVEGHGIAIPNSFFLKHRNVLDALELLAHETNHAVQEKLITDKDTASIPDMEWFHLEKERGAFIPEEEFKRRGKVTDFLDSTYYSLPTEKDSFSAQKIFRSEIENKISPIMDQKLKVLDLPPYKETKTLLKVFDVLDEFIDMGIPITEENLNKRLSQEEKEYLEKSRDGQSYEEYYKIIKSVKGRVLENFKDIF